LQPAYLEPGFRKLEQHGDDNVNSKKKHDFTESEIGDEEIIREYFCGPLVKKIIIDPCKKNDKDN
jgi:hypothetical protein